MSAIVYDFKTGRVITSAPVPKRQSTKSGKILLIRVDGQLYTLEAYNELTLEMSTGDYHKHVAIKVYVDEIDWEQTVGFDLLTQEWVMP